MLRLRLSYLYLGQSSSKTPSISKMKTTCVEFVPVPKRKQRNTFYNFSIKKKPNDVCIFDYCLLQAFITLTLAIVFCIPKSSLSRSQKEKKLKKQRKKVAS